VRASHLLSSAWTWTLRRFAHPLRLPAAQVDDIGIWIYHQKPGGFRFIVYDVGLGHGTSSHHGRSSRSSRSSRPDFHHKASSSHPLHVYAIVFKFVPVGPYAIMRRLCYCQTSEPVKLDAIQARYLRSFRSCSALPAFSSSHPHHLSCLLICDIHSHQPAMSVHASGWKLQTTWNGDSRPGEV
jgi:hypothetical protein